METVRVHITYRPLRICWAIAGGDLEAFREAVRSNHALWGGRYNPIVIVEHDSEARATVEAFRADLVVPVGGDARAKEFAASFAHLAWPFFHDGVFSSGRGERGGPVLDVGAAIDCSRNTPQWSQMQQCGALIYRWDPADPLYDVLLMHLGAYPDPARAGADYASMFMEAFGASEAVLAPDSPLPADLFDHPTISYLARHNLRESFNRFPSFLSRQGFYIGDAADLDDLVTFWNLRAANLALLFVDRTVRSRYTEVLPAWKSLYANESATSQTRPFPARSRDRHPPHAPSAPADILGEGSYRACNAPGPDCQYGRIAPPVMHFGETDTLGVLMAERERVKLTFGLQERPYVSSFPLPAQHLVASVRISAALSDRDDVVLVPPYIPELNPFYSREMHFFPDRMRIEPHGVALIVDAAASDGVLYALPTPELFKRVFELAGFAAHISSGGLIARQVIAQLGGLQGGRVFKIPGARTLLKTHTPSASFSKRSALQLIARNVEHPEVKFSEYAGLHIELRADDEKLTPETVFSYLVRKGLFRIGHDLKCSHCQLNSWFAVDDLRQRAHCQMCGAAFDATSQLIGGEWAYRRSGVLGAERNAQGAIPVVLTLQQLDTTVRGRLGPRMFSVSLDLVTEHDRQRRACEIDFAFLVPLPDRNKTAIVIGECKDRGNSPAHGGDGGTINADDIENLRFVADSFPGDRFDVFIVLAKLCPFTSSEVALAAALNPDGRARVIMLTDRELEPYFIFERTSRLFDIPEHAVSLDDLAAATVSIYFAPQPRKA